MQRRTISEMLSVSTAQKEVSDNMAFNPDCLTQAIRLAGVSEDASQVGRNPAEDKDIYLGSVLNLSSAIAEVIASPQVDQLPKRVLEEKISALWDTYNRARSYRAMSIRDDIVDAIVEKKTSLILDATTVQELKSICAEPKPYYNGNQFITSQYCIPEEEMIMWSRTSLKAPLNEAGIKRYMQLFKEIFGFLPWEGP